MGDNGGRGGVGGVWFFSFWDVSSREGGELRVLKQREFVVVGGGESAGTRYFGIVAASCSLK